MKSEKLLDAIGEVRDDYLAEAAADAGKKRRGWGKWAAAAACLCLVVGGAFVLARSQKTSPIIREELPKIAIPAYTGGSMGFEGLMEYRPEELENGNPWQEGMGLDTLPVYKNGCYDPSGAGVPVGLDEAEMAEKLHRAAQALGLDILETTRETDGTKDGEGVHPGKRVYSIRASTNCGSLRVYADGTLVYQPPDGTALPPEYHFTNSDSTAEEAEAALAYLAESYAAFLGFESPKLVLQGDYTFSGDYVRSYFVYDAASDDRTNILGYWFRRASFAPNDDGGLMLIRLNDGLIKAEKLGDYPLISVEEARRKLLDGQYQTSVPVPLPGEDAIAKVELVYRTGRQEETLLPYYRFYVELQDGDGWQMTRENGLKTYGAFYVPAIQDAYIADLPTYDGHFH